MDGEPCANLGGSIDNTAANELEINHATDPSECSYACTAHSDCEMWVFYSAHFANPDKAQKCYLKWNLSFNFATDGTISGVRGCLPPEMTKSYTGKSFSNGYFYRNIFGSFIYLLS